MLIGKDIKPGQCFRRKNDAVVEVTGERIVRGLREVELTPITGNGRVSWKWDNDVARDLLYVGTDRSCFIPANSALGSEQQNKEEE
jgi:hypothetical protein